MKEDLKRIINAEAQRAQKNRSIFFLRSLRPLRLCVLIP